MDSGFKVINRSNPNFKFITVSNFEKTNEVWNTQNSNFYPLIIRYVGVWKNLKLKQHIANRP